MAGADQDPVKVKLYLFTRNLDDSSISLPLDASKHWALLIDHYYEGEDGQLLLDTQIIIEGLQNELQVISNFKHKQEIAVRVFQRFTRRMKGTHEGGRMKAASMFCLSEV